MEKPEHMTHLVGNVLVVKNHPRILFRGKLDSLQSLFVLAQVEIHEHGGSQQIGARIAYNEIDMVLFFSDPQSNDLDADLKYITTLCDQYNIPFATNVATAEILIHGLERGDLDWRDIINPKTKPFTA